MKVKILLLSFLLTPTAFGQFTGFAVPSGLDAPQEKEKIIIVNEGLWQTDNGRLTYFEDGEIVSNQWFRDVNGKKLGDTPNDIIQINDNLIAIALNWSNIVQFINPEGKALGATEDIPNNRKLATDGNYLFATSYAHEVGVNGKNLSFEKGYVAKIDTKSFKVVAAVEVGFEPEGIAFYDGHLFVANSGGYAFQENHDYESTIHVIDATDMTVTRVIDTKQINLYGKMSQSGQYLCINSPGDYYSVDAATVLLDCRAALNGDSDDDCVRVLDIAASSNCTNADGNFFAVGSRYSFLTGSYEYNYSVINPVEVFDDEEGIYDDFPGSVRSDIEAMGMPYSIFVNPYTGYIYATDAGEYTGAGALYQWSPQGNFLGKHKTYINPAHFLALPPDGHLNATECVAVDSDVIKHAVFNLQGLPVEKLLPGHLYISNGKKFIYNNF